MLTVNSAGILASGGTTAINAWALTSGGISMDVHVAGAGTVLNLNAPIINETNGMVKADAGTLLFNAAVVLFRHQGRRSTAAWCSSTGANNTLPVQSTSTVPTVLPWASTAARSTSRQQPGGGQPHERERLAGHGRHGHQLRPSRPVNLFANPSADVTFGGTISDNAAGPLSLYKPGGNNLTLTAPSTYQGSTNVQGGGPGPEGPVALPTTSAVNVNYATLTWDNTGLAADRFAAGQRAAEHERRPVDLQRPHGQRHRASIRSICSRATRP